MAMNAAGFTIPNGAERAATSRQTALSSERDAGVR